MAASAVSGQTAVVPARLGFLAIFNPSLGATDETIDDQIVYYASLNAQSQKRRYRSRGKPTADVSQEERNERLRQIGLAQGMVEFSRGFANGEPVDTVETEKTRVLLQEVESGWWILASIDLTKIPLPPRIGSPAPGEAGEQPENVEYSSRELKPSALLLRDLLRAHSIFLLHHAPSLSALFVKSRRSNFVKILTRYWDLFLSTWDVMLHGNPASNVFRGIKIAACGELGVGVGEENRGSGEREVLEGFVGRIEGLTDLVVSKFGSSESVLQAETARDGKSDISTALWLGTGDEAGAEDGAIFLGVGALSRKSLRDITYWMEDIYSWGENAYGVQDSPASTRQIRRRRKSIPATIDNSESQSRPSNRTTNPSHGSSTRATPPNPTTSEPTGSVREGGPADEGGMNKFMSYLKMGYGTHWSLGSPEDGTRANTPTREDSQPAKASEPTSYSPPATCGQYLVGLLGDMEESSSNEEEGGDRIDTPTEASEYNSRIVIRTLTVELDDGEMTEAQHTEDLGSQKNELTLTKSGKKDHTNPNSQFDSQDRNKTQKMRVVVYVTKPFVFTFLFRNGTDSLAWDGLYRSLHHQLAPLRKPLIMSTAYRPDKPDAGEKASHIFDLVWDPKAMTIHSTVPSIPTPAEVPQESATAVWSRAEAVNTHNQILDMYVATLANASELERTCKTGRGWWVVWTRILERDCCAQPDPDTAGASEENPEGRVAAPPAQKREDDAPRASPAVSKEIFLIRRAGERAGLRGIGGGGSYAENASGGWAESAGRLAQGIGVDTHKYIEGLLSMGR
ncbi:hypothetical protein F4802DRAFT_604613 [Xylaria palmicola]|nr:hypothetical protein F4802DRAFT_604613 [Xylaria palmicola]